MRGFRFLYLIIGVLCLGTALLLSIFFAFTNGNAIALMVGLLFVGVYFTYPRFAYPMKKLLNFILIIIGIYMICSFIFIGWRGAKNTATFKEDCVLVLGCGIRGEKVLPTLQFRLDKCIDYLQHNPKAIIIVSGGKGRGETICESEAMKHYLVSKGINADQIIEENQSKNTRQNMQFSKTILDTLYPSGVNSVACITSDFHAYRANILSKKSNISVSNYNSKTAWYLYPAAYCRETLSIIKMWMGF